MIKVGDLYQREADNKVYEVVSIGEPFVWVLHDREKLPVVPTMGEHPELPGFTKL